MYPIKGKYSTAYVMVEDLDHVIEEDEYKQILEFVNCHVFTNDSRIMPDYHYGAGCVIGFTMPMTHQIIPNIVGVDIGCNMMYSSFQKFLDFNRKQWLAVDRQIRKHIPMAKECRRKSFYDNFDNNFPWSISTLQMQVFTSKLNHKFETEYKGAEYTPKWFFEVCERVNCKPVRAVNSIGSLGGGNHFIEFSTSERTGNSGVTVHSGSRNFGLKVANYWQKKAKENMKKAYITDFNEQIKAIKADWPQAQWNKRIMEAKNPPTATGLEYLEGDDWYGYLHEMNFAQIYAQENISIMMSVILQTLNLPVTLMMSTDTVHTVHNYINFEDFIIRKGAVRSIKGQKLLIPFNMEDGILVCEGKSNEEWNCSAPHGAGRLFGRKDMKRRKDINVRDIRDRMNEKGICLSVVPKDEVKEAYKDPKFIERAIKPTATIIDRLRPVLPLKADD
jgi:RNA-splicing ligase RtcB